MVKKLLWALLGIVIVVPIVAGLAGIKISQFTKMGDQAAAMVVPPTTVTSIKAREQMWQPRISSVGSVKPVQGAIISTEAAGVVREIAFEPGTTATKGQLLVQLDIGVEQAQLQAAVASAKLAAVTFERAKELRQGQAGTISQQEYDEAAVGLKQALAEVENLKAVIAKKAVLAPFSGKLGIQQVSVGEFLQQGSPVVSLQSLDPVYVDFSLPQQRLGDLAQGLNVLVTTDAYPDEQFEGEITAINPNVDLDTRNVRIQATLSNNEGLLRPGMFVSVDVILEEKKKVLFIPITAVAHATYGDSVFVIEENESATDPDADKTTAALVVREQIIRLGDRHGDFVDVTKGLKAGETVVSTGVFKLRTGTGVVIDNTLAPKFKLNPTPENT